MPVLKAVIDTSVMVSVAFARQGIARELRELTAAKMFTIVTSKAILKELFEVLHYPHIVRRFNPSQSDIRDFFSMVIENAMVTRGAYRANGITLDPKDDMFIACALEGNADYIVSRDPHLRNIKHFQGIQIIDATMFVNKIKSQAS